MNSNLPAQARIVIVGGGAVGCGVAHALVEAGFTDILLVERSSDVGEVTTSQGAGFLGQPRDSLERVKLAMRSVAVFRELQKDPDAKPDWHEVGSLRIALTDKRAKEFQLLKKVADEAGLETALIDAAEATRRFPRMNFSKATAILWCPSDGYMTPQKVVKAYQNYCAKRGVKFATDVTVENIVRQNGHIEGVKTSRGTVNCERIINAAGAHAYHVAKMAGLDLPIVPVRHEYYVTLPMPGLTPDLPCLRIPDLTLYARVRDQGLLLGGWEPNAVHTDPRVYNIAGTPPKIEPDWKVLDSFTEKLLPLFPTARAAKANVVSKGWPTFTPDGRFIIGESSQVRGFVMAGGCNAHGISGSAGIGSLLVQSLRPNQSDYVKSLSPDRFTSTSWNWDDACRKARSVYETYYGI